MQEPGPEFELDPEPDAGPEEALMHGPESESELDPEPSPELVEEHDSKAPQKPQLEHQQPVPIRWVWTSEMDLEAELKAHDVCFSQLWIDLTNAGPLATKIIAADLSLRTYFPAPPLTSRNHISEFTINRK